MPRARTPRLTLLFLTLACGACVGAPRIVQASAAGCSELIPGSWREGIEGAPLPQGDTVGDWVSFADAQTGRLDQANGRTRDAIELVSRCEARDAAAVKSARPKFLGPFR